MEITEHLVEKVPPQSVEAEMGVLGAMLFSQEAVFRAVEMLRESFFYLEAHRHIFSGMTSLFDRGEAIDLITLTEEMRRRKVLDRIGGASYLAQLTASVNTAANVEFHARIVKEKALLRELINAATKMVQEGFDATAEGSEVLERAERMIFDISQNRIEGDYARVGDIIKDSIEAIDQLYQRKEHVTGLATGFHEFDTKTAGLQPADFIVVAGRPSMGKSAFVSCIVEHAGITLNKPVAFFSLEMSKEQLVQRMLCSHARVDAQKVRTGYLSHSDWPKLTNAAGKLSEAPIFIDDTPALSVLDLRAKARRLKLQHNIELVIVDYLQLMDARTRGENRQQEITLISRSIKALARELRVPVVAISQLSRAVEQRTGNRPQLSDLRESGAIEQDADLVVFLFREEYYNPTEENRNMAEAIIAKQRNGPVGTCQMVFFKEYTRFDNPEFHHRTQPVET